MKTLFVRFITIAAVLCFSGCPNNSGSTTGFTTTPSSWSVSDHASAKENSHLGQECVREYDDEGNLDSETYYENGKITYAVYYKNGSVIVSNEYRYDHKDQLVEALRFEPDGSEYLRLQYRYTPDGVLDTVILIRGDEVKTWDHISQGQNSDYPHRINALW